MKTPHFYFAVQMKSGETSDNVAQLVLATIRVKGLKSKYFEAVGILSLGTGRYVRFRTDCGAMTSVLDALYDSGRGIIGTHDGSYTLRTPNGRQGTVSLCRMLSDFRQSQIYVGVRDADLGPQLDSAN